MVQLAKRWYDVAQYPKAGRRRTQNKKLFNFLVRESKKEEKFERMKFEKVRFD